MDKAIVEYPVLHVALPQDRVSRSLVIGKVLGLMLSCSSGGPALSGTVNPTSKKRSGQLLLLVLVLSLVLGLLGISMTVT